MPNLASMSTDELITAQRANSVARGKSDAPFKATGRSIQAELDGRAGEARLAAALEGVPVDLARKVVEAHAASAEQE